MKKFAVILLALVMVFALTTTAFAADTQITFNDMQGVSSRGEEAIYRLASLGVLEGDAGFGGPVRPHDNVIRAEYIKILVYVAGKSGNADFLQNTKGIFSDVTPANWYNGVVNAAQQAGLIIGYDDKTAKPKQDVTQNEVITVVMRALGYNDKLEGSWPTNYVLAANYLGLLDGVVYNGNAAASREFIAIVVDNALELDMVTYAPDSTSLVVGEVVNNALRPAYGSYLQQLAVALGVDLDDLIAAFQGEGNFFVTHLMQSNGVLTAVKNANHYITTGYSLLNHVFDAFAVHGMQFFDTNHHYSEAAAWGYEDYEDGQLVFNFDDHIVVQDDPLGLSLGFKVADYYGLVGSDLLEAAGRFADIVVNEDGEVLFANVTSDVLYVNDITFTENRNNLVVEARADGKTYELADFAYANHDGFWGEAHIALGSVGVNDLDYGKLYLDEDGYFYAYKTYDQFENDDYGIVEDVDSDFIYFEDVAGYSRAFSVHSYPDALNNYHNRFTVNADLFSNLFDNFVVYKDGALASVSDIEAGDTVYATRLCVSETIVNHVNKFDPENTILLLVSSPVSGKLESIGEYDIYVDGVKYLSWDRINMALSRDNGETFTVFPRNLTTDVFTSVVYAPAYAFRAIDYIVADLESSVHGVITKVVEAGHVSAWHDGYVTLLLADGTKATYDLEADSVVNGFERGDLVTLWLNSDDEVFDIDMDVAFAHNTVGVQYEAIGSDNVIRRTNDNSVFGTLDDNAVVWFIDVNETYNDAGYVGTDGSYKSADVYTVAELKALGDFWSYQLEVAASSSRNGKITELYLVSADEADAVARLVVDKYANTDGFFLKTHDGKTIEIPNVEWIDIQDFRRPFLGFTRIDIATGLAAFDELAWTVTNSGTVTMNHVDEATYAGNALYADYSWDDEAPAAGSTTFDVQFASRTGEHFAITENTVVWDMTNNVEITNFRIENYAADVFTGNFFWIADVNNNILFVAVL